MAAKQEPQSERDQRLLAWVLKEVAQSQHDEMYGRLLIVFEAGVVKRIIREHSIVPQH